MLSPDEVKLLLPRKRLSPFIAPSPASISSPDGDEAGDDEASFLGRASEPEGLAPKAGRPPRKPVAASYIWTDLVRIDVVSAPPSTEVVFQGPNTMRVYGLPLLESEDAVSIDPNADDEQGDASSSSSSRKKIKYLSCAESVQSRGGQVPHSVIIKSQGNRMPLADIAVSGVPGWVTLYAPFAKTDLRIRVWVPRGVEVFVRPPLPCASPFKADADKNGEPCCSDECSSMPDAVMSLLCCLLCIRPCADGCACLPDAPAALPGVHHLLRSSGCGAPCVDAVMQHAHASGIQCAPCCLASGRSLAWWLHIADKDRLPVLPALQLILMMMTSAPS